MGCTALGTKPSTVRKEEKNKIQEKRFYTNSRLAFWDIPEATIIGQGCYN